MGRDSTLDRGAWDDIWRVISRYPAYPRQLSSDPPMKIHNTSDKFQKIHSHAIATGLANAIQRGSCVGDLFSFWMNKPTPVGEFPDFEDGEPVGVASTIKITFEITRNPKTYELELTPADEDALIAIQDWEEFYKDYTF